MENYCFQCRFFKPAEYNTVDFDNTTEELILEWSNQPENEEFSYDCCRYPPVYAGKEKNEGGHKQSYFKFPEVNLFYWCGEFQPRSCYQGKEVA